MTTRSGKIYLKTFAPFAKKTKVHAKIEDICAEEICATPRYPVNIDFDEASIAWRANKIRVGESWSYKPTHPPVQTSQSSSIASRVKERHIQSQV
jgi:hypothetical protein